MTNSTNVQIAGSGSALVSEDGVEEFNGNPCTVPGYSVTWGFQFGTPSSRKNGPVSLRIGRPRVDILESPGDKRVLTRRVTYRVEDTTADWSFIDVLMPFDEEENLDTVRSLVELAAIKHGFVVKELIWMK